MKKNRTGIVFITLYCLATPLQAMQLLDESELSLVSGQDGLSLSLASEQLQAGQVAVAFDSGSTTHTAVIMDKVQLSPLAQTAEGEKNKLLQYETGKQPLVLDATLDVGSHQNIPALGFTLNSPRPLMMTIDRVQLGTCNITSFQCQPGSDRHFGSLALQGRPSFTFINQRGVLDNFGNGLSLVASLENANLFYRQLWDGQAALVLGNLNAHLQVQEGSLGIGASQAVPPSYSQTPMITQAGLRLASGFLDARLSFDQLFQAAGTAGYQLTGREHSFLHLGWQGTLLDTEVILKSGSLPHTSKDGTRTEGLALSARWNFLRSDRSSSLLPGSPLSLAPTNSRAFSWQAGNVHGIAANGGHPLRLEFTDWRNLPGAQHGFSFPFIGLTAISAGQVLPGLCWGATANAVAADCTRLGGSLVTMETPAHLGAGLALSIRDGNFLSYAEKVRMFDSTDPTQPFDASMGYNREMDWGLVFTLANINGDIHLHPGGNLSQPEGGPWPSQNGGITANILLMSQTLQAGNGLRPQGSQWGRGSHVMIADTEADMAIGLMDNSLLIQSPDTRLWLRDISNTDPYSGGIDIFSPKLRLGLVSTFGGLDLADTSRVLRGALFRLNYQGMMNIRLSPAPQGQHYLGYSGAFWSNPTRVNQPQLLSYFSAAEAGRPDIELRLNHISGLMAISNGRMDLIGASEEDDGQSKLRLSQDIPIGLTAVARTRNGLQDPALVRQLDQAADANKVLRINAVELAGKSLGTLIIPSGQLHSSLTLRSQLPHPDW